MKYLTILLVLLMAACTQQVSQPQVLAVSARENANTEAPAPDDWANITRTKPDEYGVVCYFETDTPSLSCVKVTQ